MERLPRLHELIDEWNALAADSVFSHPLDLNGWAARLEPGLRVLDLGCGYGRATRTLVDSGFQAVGVDVAPAMVARGLEERPDLTLLAVEPGPLPFADASFDAACLLAVLTCLPSAEDREAVVAELRRVVRPGGWVLVSDLLVQADARNLERYQAGERRYGARWTFRLADGPVLRHFEERELLELFGAFELDLATPFEVRTMREHPARALRLWLRRA